MIKSISIFNKNYFLNLVTKKKNNLILNFINRKFTNFNNKFSDSFIIKYQNILFLFI